MQYILKESTLKDTGQKDPDCGLVLKKLRNCVQSWYLHNKFGRSFQNICISVQKLCEYSLKVGTDVVAKLKRLYAKLVPLYQVWYKATKCSRFLKHWGFCLPTNLTSNVQKFGTHRQAQAQIPHNLQESWYNTFISTTVQVVKNGQIFVYIICK